MITHGADKIINSNEGCVLSIPTIVEDELIMFENAG